MHVTTTSRGREATSPRAQRRPAQRRRSGPVGRILGLLLRWGLVAGIWLAIAAGMVVTYYGLTLPDTSSLTATTRKPSIRLASADGAVFASQGGYHGPPATLAEMSLYLPAAVVAIEDRRFHSHFGIDLLGLARAMYVNLAAGEIRQGGSTLTQQLAKNLFLTPEKSLGRKVQEFLLALWLERRFSKEQILTIYLNRVYLGSGTFGVAAAADRYFGKSPKQLNLMECAIIAGLLKAPSRYSPANNPDKARERAGTVLAAMVDTGAVESELAEAAWKQPLGQSSRAVPGSGGRYFADWVLDQVGDFVPFVDRDLIVTTTLDAKLQRLAESEVEAILAAQGAARSVGQAAVVVLGHDGAVRAMVGGRDYRDSQFNRATQALRQPGSAFKPFVYIAGLERGIGPDQSFVDQPIAIRGWSPRNYDGTYHGSMSVLDALAQSVNTIAVQVQEKAGRAQVIAVARRLGITTDLENAPSLALGTSEVTLLELTQAYGALASGGIGVWAHGIVEIKDVDGKILYRRSGGGPGRVIRPADSRQMTAMLSQAIANGTGKAAAIGPPAAGKTGTSQSYRDAWFVGYTADLVAGVWVGNDDGSAMKGVTGGNVPAQLWAALMRKAHEGKPVRSLVEAAEPEPIRWFPSLRPVPVPTSPAVPSTPAAEPRARD
jgi:penicillin-binding protein 1A